jgi:hypothetical protein
MVPGLVYTVHEQRVGGGLRQGHPGRQQLKDDTLRKKVQAVEKALAKLRAKFDELTQAGIIRHCECHDPDCPVYFMPLEAARDLEILRRESVRLFRDAYPAFDEPSGW